MHIEINAGGLSAGIAVAEYQLNMAGFISEAEDVISSFKAVTGRTYALSGGVGLLQEAVDELNLRIQREEKILRAAQEVRQESNDFLELAMRVDQQVADMVELNREEFYRVNPWLRPEDESDGPWYEDAWNWLCGVGEAVAQSVEQLKEWAADTLKKAWDGLVEFYNDHKKLIDTVLLVVGAIGAIAAVIATGGLALAPLLGALGISAGVAAAISTAVAVVAVVSTVAATSLNVVDIWFEIDDPVFNAWQTGLNITSTITNLAYSIGNIYNTFKKIDPIQYAKQVPAKQVPAGTTFDDGVTVVKDNLSDSRYFAKGEHYDDFVDFWEGGSDGYRYVSADTPDVQYVRAKDIEGVYLNQSEIDNPAAFWNKRYSKNEYLDYVLDGGIKNNPVEVTNVNNQYYYFSGDGRHRVLAAMELDIDIPVIIKGFYYK